MICSIIPTSGTSPQPAYKQPCASTTSSESKLESESATAKLNESLHCALPPIFVTTEYHRTPHSSAQPLGPYVTPPDAGSILPAFNSPFDPHELEHPTIRSQVDGKAFFIANGESDYFWDVTRICDEGERRQSCLKVQGIYERLQRRQEHERQRNRSPQNDGRLKQEQTFDGAEA